MTRGFRRHCGSSRFRWRASSDGIGIMAARPDLSPGLRLTRRIHMTAADDEYIIDPALPQAAPWQHLPRIPEPQHPEES